MSCAFSRSGTSIFSSMISNTFATDVVNLAIQRGRFAYQRSGPYIRLT